MDEAKYVKKEWVIRKTVDESGDYPFPTYDILEINKWGPRGIGTAYQDPNVARMFASSVDMLSMLSRIRNVLYTPKSEDTISVTEIDLLIAKATGEE
jgi:hypothetical protein